MPALVIARLVLVEASRRRLLIAVAVLTLVVIGFTAWGFERLTSLSCGPGRPCSPLETRAIAATLLVLVSFMYSFVFTVGAVFVAAPAVSAEIESGVVLAMLPRPIRRSDLIVGKWLGLAALAGGYITAAMSLEFIAVNAAVGYTPPQPVFAILFMIGQSLVMLTLTLLASTRLPAMTAGIVVLILFGFAWIGGIARAIGTALEAETVRDVGFVSSLIVPTDGLWRGTLFHLQPSLLAEAVSTNRAFAANPFFAHEPPGAGYLVWAAVWTAGILGLAVLSFQRREL